MAASRSRSSSAARKASAKPSGSLSLGKILTPDVCPLFAKPNSGKFLASNILGGVLQCLISLLIGFIPPTAIGWYAMLVKAHVSFMFNGCLAILLAMIGPEIGKSLSASQMKVWALTMHLGTFLNGAAHLKGAISGTKCSLIRTMGRAPHGDDPVMEGMLMMCGVCIVIAVALTVLGLHKRIKA
mmetsp:Transcript_3841/g.10991  ORF Transcript_3841/g.10991 Transcript_3841/m.10991 type:complete len:184 (-) Transcript_3841:1128-1679(-)